jgi:hypothetical protein
LLEVILCLLGDTDTRKVRNPSQKSRDTFPFQNEGEKVSPGDVVCDIQTDKAVMSLEVDEEGILAKIIKPADSGSIKVNK